MAERIDPIKAIRKITSNNSSKTKQKQNGKNSRSAETHKQSAPVEKILFDKPGNFLYPVPCVMVSCVCPGRKPNIITVAWTGTICSDPPMLSISVRQERYSYEMIKESGEFAVNLTNRRLARAADFCGCRSGRDIDKFEECQLTPVPCTNISAPMIGEAPVSLECKVTGIIPLGSHDMFLAEIVGVQVDRRYLDHNGTFHMENAGLITYSHGKYYELGKILGSFGYSVRKKR